MLLKEMRSYDPVQILNPHGTFLAQNTILNKNRPRVPRGTLPS